jgi:hypothetical protein
LKCRDVFCTFLFLKSPKQSENNGAPRQRSAVSSLITHELQ